MLPEQTHSVELGFRYKGNAFTLANTLYYRYEYDAFTELRQSLDDNTVLTTIENLNAQQSAGLEIVLNSNLFARSNINLTGNVFHRTIDATDLGYAGQKRVVSGNIKVNSMFQIGAVPGRNSTPLLFSLHQPSGQKEPLFLPQRGLASRCFATGRRLPLPPPTCCTPTRSSGGLNPKS
ncbi:MAG: TonB-dependent receptor [Haliscomenobacter sp.]|nr:TonB-dependent receptor [Haliscomenobacter sp.]